MTTKTTVVCTEVATQRELPSRSGSLTATLTARSSCGYSWLAGRNFSITVAALVLVRPPGERPTHGHPRSPRLLEVRAHPELYVRAVRMVLLDCGEIGGSRCRVARFRLSVLLGTLRDQQYALLPPLLTTTTTRWTEEEFWLNIHYKTSFHQLKRLFLDGFYDDERPGGGRHRKRLDGSSRSKCRLMAVEEVARDGRRSCTSLIIVALIMGPA